MARQFIVKEDEIVKIKDDLYEIISKEEVKHIQVLRYNLQDRIVINNKVYEVEKMTKSSIIVRYIEDSIQNEKSNIEVTLYQAFLKNEMMDLTIKKAVELGVHKIQPFFSNNVVVKLDLNKDREKKKEKLEKIVIEAVKQCGRTDIPEVLTFKKLEELDESISENEINILAYEKETISLKETIENIKRRKMDIKRIGIIVGPEGGFREEEIEKLKQIPNVYTVSLGLRILRAETASINLLSIVNYEFEK